MIEPVQECALSGCCLQQTLDDLAELARDPDADAAPAEEVRAFTETILWRALDLMSHTFPYGDIGPDMMNGLDVAWESRHRRVTLAVPSNPSRRRYIYHREGEQYDVTEATAEQLAAWLDWLSEDG